MQYQVAFVASMLIASTAAVGDGTFKTLDYASEGRSWKDAFPTCAKEVPNQSPIDVTEESVVKRDPLNPYQKNWMLRGSDFGNLVGGLMKMDKSGNAKVSLDNKGFIWADYASVVNFDAGVKSIGKQEQQMYVPFELTFKAPAEHKMFGQQHDLEMQVSLKKMSTTEGTNENTVAAVMSVFFNNPTDNQKSPTSGASMNNKFISSLQLDQSSTTTTKLAEVDMDGFLQSLDVSKYYEYDGTITEPPCTGNVKWFLIPDVQSLGKVQKNKINAHWLNQMNNGYLAMADKNGNARETQPLGDRTVKERHNINTSSEKVLSFYTSATSLSLTLTAATVLAFTAF